MTFPVLSPGLKRRKVPTRPSFRAAATSATATTSSETTHAITIPAAASAAGTDYAIFSVFYDNYTGTVTPPDATYKNLGTVAFQTGAHRLTIFGKFVASGDPGASKTFTITGGSNSHMLVACAVYANVGGVSVMPAFQWTPYANTLPSAAAITVPNIKANPYDLQIIVQGGRAFGTSTGGAGIAALPAGFTSRGTISCLPFVQQEVSMTVGDGLPNPGDMLIQQNTESSQSVMQMALYAVGESPRERIPKSIVGKPIFQYGASYRTHVGTGPYAGWPDAARLEATASFPANSNNMGVQGDMCPQICSFAYGSFTRDTRGPSGGTDFTVTQAGTFYSLPTHDALFLVETVGNDALQDGTTANGGTTDKSRAGYQNALHALLTLIRSDQRHLSTDSSIVYTGTWTATADTWASGGTYKSAGPGAYFEITTTETDIDVVLLAYDDAAIGSSLTGAPFSVTVNGVDWGVDGTTSNQMRMPNTGSSSTQRAFCQMAVPVHGMPAGTKTIRVTNTGSASTQSLSLDCWLRPSATPPTIITLTIPHFTDALFTSGAVSSSNAIIDIYIGYLETEVAKYPPGQVLLLDVLADGLWNPAEVWTDNLHKRDWNEVVYIQGVLRTLREQLPDR